MGEGRGEGREKNGRRTGGRTGEGRGEGREKDWEKDGGKDERRMGEGREKDREKVGQGGRKEGEKKVGPYMWSFWNSAVCSIFWSIAVGSVK